jgi:hypothetical protein
MSVVLAVFRAQLRISKGSAIPEGRKIVADAGPGIQQVPSAHEIIWLNLHEGT